MFRSFIYLNEDKMYTYQRLIDGGTVRPKSINKKKIKSAKAGLNQSALSYTNEESFTADIERDPFWDYDSFELSLSKLVGEDYFDFMVNASEYEITTIPQMKIIRIQGFVEIPEAFDFFNLVEKYKPTIIRSMETESHSDNELLHSILGNATADIPIVINYDNISIVGRLSTKWLIEDYTALEDYAEQEVTFLCKVIGISQQENVTIFNPLKDFIKLNRAMRRYGNFEGDDELLNPIVIKGPVVNVEFIALYK